MAVKRHIVCLCAILWLTGTGRGFAQSQSQPSWVELSLGQVNSTYSEAAIDVNSEKSSSSSDLKYASRDYQLDLGFKGNELRISSSSASGSEQDSWSNRSETTIDLSYHFSDFPWLSPIIGYFQVKQSENDRASAPAAAFLSTNRLLALGLTGEVIPLVFATKHQVILQGRYRNLTALDRLGNRGQQIMAGLGYLYAIANFSVGIEFQFQKHAVFARQIRIEDGTTEEVIVEDSRSGSAVMVPLRFEWNTSRPSRGMGGK